MDDFLQEIESDIRTDKMMKFWRQYQKPITWGLTGLIGCVAAWNMWTWHTNRQLNQWAESFAKARSILDQGKIEESMRYLETLSKTNSNYATLSLFSMAHFYAQEGDHQNREKAVEYYNQITKNSNTKPDLKEYAHLCSIMTRLDEKEPSLDTLIKEIEPLTSGKYWSLLAQEIKGMILMQMNQHKEASDVFVALAQNPDCPPATRNRANLMARGSTAIQPETPRG